MKSLQRAAAVVLIGALVCTMLSSCSLAEYFKNEIKEGIEEGLAELETEQPKGFEASEYDVYTSVDSSAYRSSPYYIPVSCTVSYDLLETQEEKDLYDRLMENVYKVNESSYSSIYQSLFRCEQVIMEGMILSETQVRTVVRAIYDDHPELFWLTVSFEYMTDEDENYSAVILYSCYSSKDIAQWMPQMHESVDSFIASVPEGLSEYEREKLTHDYIIDNCYYNESDANILEFYHSAYGVMVKGKAVCEGYAKAFQMLLNLLGIECVGITGEGLEPEDDSGEEAGEEEEENSLHMWNSAKIDGEWYLVDATWDDAEDFARRYVYFNGTSEMFSSDHIPSKLVSELSDEEINGEETYWSIAMNIFVPECSATDYCYLLSECACLDSYYDTEDLTDAMLKAAENKEDSFIFYVDPEFSSMDDALDNLIYDYPQYIFDYLNYVNNRLPDYSINTESVTFDYDENLSYIILFFEYDD